MEHRMVVSRGRPRLLLALALGCLVAACSAPQSAGGTSGGAAKYQGFIEVGGGVRL